MLVDWGVSIRRACAALRFDTSSYHYKHRRPDQAGLEMRIKEICETRVRYGYRRVHVLLLREGWRLNMKKTRRIYKLATGKKLRILTIVDTHSRYSPVTDPRFNYKAEDVVRTLERVCKKIGYPNTIRVDNGSEFISRDLDLWAYVNKVTLDFSRPGKPTDNAFIEAFNSKFRQECLNTHWFMTLADAQEKLEAWRRDYNEVRPHSAIGYNVPVAIHNPDGATSPPS